MKVSLCFTAAIMLAASVVSSAASDSISPTLLGSEWINEYIGLKNAVANCELLTMNAEETTIRSAMEKLLASSKCVATRLHSQSNEALLKERLGKVVVINDAAINQITVKFGDGKRNESQNEGFFVREATPENARSLCARAAFLQKRLTAVLNIQ